MTARGGRTYTRGLVFHATPWLSLTYNTSNNMQLGSGRDVFGEQLPITQGKGTDYGVKLALFQRRIFLELVYYENAAKDKSDLVHSTPAGDFKTPLDRIWEDVADFTGDTKYRSPPYSSILWTWTDIVTTSSTGWEFSATVNASDRWRITFNGSKRSNTATSPRGPTVRRYLATYLPLIKSHPEWQNLSSQGSTVAEKVTGIEATLRNLDAIGSLPSDIYAPNWGINLVQSYEFAKSHRLFGLPLVGVTVGGNMNMRGQTIDGFGETATGVLDANLPYYAPRKELFGAMVSYRRKIFRDRIDWRLQFNVRNIFDAYTVFPLRAVDARDGRHSKATVIYLLNEPRTWQLTSAFRF
jgi:hypothetical protein